MNTYLQISALIYISLIAFEYFRKKKINTIENIAFRTILCSVIVVTIMDLISTIVAIYTNYHFIEEFLIKVFLGTLVVWIFFFSFYVYCISSDKAVANVEFKNHPNKKTFQKALLSTILGIAVVYILITTLPLQIYVQGETFYYEGPAMTLAYISTGGGAVTWIIQLFRNRKKLKDKRYIPVYCFFGMAASAIGFQIAFPTLSIVTPIAVFITAIMFFSMENPDATLINKLNEAKSIAEDANDAKTSFLSSMSHEIRTPLNAIVGFGQALAKEDISGTAKEEVQDILMASNTLLDIVNGILDIQKIEANKIELVNGEYNTKKMISEITSLINARIGSKPLDFKVIIDENMPAILYGDSMRVKQIIINLLTNAVKYTEEGRILFQIKADNANGISKLTISVQDTGMGMTEEALEQLFTKFQRFDMEKNSNVEGTGLGMAITKGLIDLMDGEINVKSKYGEGSTFFVTINQKIIQQTIEEEEKTDDTTKAFNASGQHVLVVDDNKINLKVAKRLLSEYKVTIELANSGSECIDKVLDGKVYDLIFMDIMMPKMNGMETLENLKNIVGFKMPVVALTADVISGMEEKYISKGFDDCLAKPIVEEELYYMLRKFLKETKEEPAQEEKDETPATETKTIEQPKEVAPVIVESKVEEPTPVVETKEEEESNPNDIHNVELLKNNKINVDAGLELLKDMEMYDMTLEEFYNELQNKIKDLTEFKESGNMDDYAILAHALKTEARYVGCNELGDMAYEHELAGKEKNQDKVNEKFDELITEANRVYKIIKRYLGE